MNIYAAKMRNTVQAYAADVKEIEAKKKQNSATYLPDVAKDENAKLEERRKDLYYRALDAMDEIESKARADAVRFGRLDAAELTDDIKILQSGIKLTTEDINALIDKHITNGTMLRAISDYTSEHKLPRNFIPTSESKANAWAAIATTGRSLIESINRNPEGGPMQDKAVSSWLDENGGGATLTPSMIDVLTR